MAEEIAALERTGTWDVVPLLPYVTPITYKWVYKVKTWSDVSLEHYKACLMAHGFQQEHGHDYEETFALVAHMTTIWTLLALVLSSFRRTLMQPGGVITLISALYQIIVLSLAPS